MKNYYQLVRIFGGVEPELIEGQISPDEKSLADAVIKHLQEEPYDEDDGLFYLFVENGVPSDICAFSGGEMDELRSQAGQLD